MPWKFDVCPDNFWKYIENQRKFMDWAAQQLNIKEPSDWYKITFKVRKFSENSQFQGYHECWGWIFDGRMLQQLSLITHNKCFPRIQAVAMEIQY
jgi:hypothetical protein